MAGVVRRGDECLGGFLSKKAAGNLAGPNQFGGSRIICKAAVYNAGLLEWGVKGESVPER